MPGVLCIINSTDFLAGPAALGQGIMVLTKKEQFQTR